MNARQANRNIRLYYLFQLFKEQLFWGPILISYIQAVSYMSLAEIYFMEAICLTGLMILEVPSGALADLLGRKRTIFLGTIFIFFEGLIFALASNKLMIWIANSIWVVGFSLISGADNSLIYDTLKVVGREEEYKKIEGRSAAYRLLTVAICSIFVGYLAELSWRLPLFLSLIFIGLNCLVTYGFAEPPFAGQKKYQARDHWQIMKISLLFVANHAKVKWVICFTVVVGVISKVWFFTYNPYFELVELPLAYYGWIFFLLNLVAAIFSHEADRLYRWLGDWGSILLILILVSVPIMAMGFLVAPAMVLLVLTQNIVRGYTNPFMGHFLHRYLDSHNRATVFSIKSAARGLGEFVMLGGFSLLLCFVTLPTALQILGGFSLVIGGGLVLSYCRVFLKEEK